ncbi:STAS domain-containing protein [Spirillospora sp. NPDC029432]|uniref:STAS domain-containing protein n=1 Tax=Spirillospora sp. NPDC029432 TaxID=3154599 RepID=UPI0034516381
MKKTTVQGLRTRTERGFVVLTLPPETGWHNYSAIREALCEALTAESARNPSGLVVDLTDTILLDAAGLVLLARTQTRANLLGRTLRIVVPATALRTRQALHVTGLARLVPMYPHLESATVPPPARPHRRRAAADGTHVLDAIRALYPDDNRLSLYLPDTELTIETAPAPDDGHLMVSVGGVLDEVTTSQLGEALTSMIERNAHHLMVRMHDRIRVRCDPFPVLLGIRWRASAEGGCLSLAGVPPRLRQIIDREGLRSAFQSCRRLAVPAPAAAPAGGTLTAL